MFIAFKNKVEHFLMRIFSNIIRFEFHKESSKFNIYPSVRIDNPENIIIETDVTLYRRGWIYAIVSDTSKPIIHIKKHTKIYDNFHITCSDKLEIGSSCLINRNVLITDTIHNYEDIIIPIIDQGIRNSPTKIGDHCWIGNNSVIISSVIGKHCVISANTVIVNKTIPDYSVVAGNPGKIIKKYNFLTKNWESNFN